MLIIGAVVSLVALFLYITLLVQPLQKANAELIKTNKTLNQKLLNMKQRLMRSDKNLSKETVRSKGIRINLKAAESQLCTLRDTITQLNYTIRCSNHKLKKLKKSYRQSTAEQSEKLNNMWGREIMADELKDLLGEWLGFPAIVSDIIVNLVNPIRAIFENEKGAFAYLYAIGEIRAHGKRSCGGDTWPVQNHLVNVESVTATSGAFAALKRDNSVVCWGDRLCGGILINRKHVLLDVESIVASKWAFAAIIRDKERSVVCWGKCGYSVPGKKQTLLVNVESITAAREAFAALKRDGTVVCWGAFDTSYKQKELVNVKSIIATENAFAALRSDGRVVCWGESVEFEEAKAKIVETFGVEKLAPFEEDGRMNMSEVEYETGDSLDCCDSYNAEKNLATSCCDDVT